MHPSIIHCLALRGYDVQYVQNGLQITKGTFSAILPDKHLYVARTTIGNFTYKTVCDSLEELEEELKSCSSVDVFTVNCNRICTLTLISYNDNYLLRRFRK